MTAEQALPLALLLVFAAGLGWAGARYTGRRRAAHHAAPLPAEFYRGFSLLLREQADEALEALLRAARLDTDTLEIQFALGALFRRRGEVDRAIRVHEDILARPQLDQGKRDEAVLALGEDYLSAGLLDRAESLFRQLDEGGAQRASALRNLVRIYEQQKDWEQAAAVRAQLEHATGECQRHIVAHYFCELAETARDEGDLARADEHLRDARRADPAGVRPALLDAGLALQSRDPKRAASLYREVVEREPALIAEVLPQLAACFEGESGQQPLDAWLADAVRGRPDMRMQVGFALILHGWHGLPLVGDCVREYVEHNVTAARLLESTRASNATAPEPKILAQVVEVLRHLSRGIPPFRCANCGYASSTLYWQCPGCRTWGSSRAATALRLEYRLQLD